MRKVEELCGERPFEKEETDARSETEQEKELRERKVESKRIRIKPLTRPIIARFSVEHQAASRCDRALA